MAAKALLLLAAAPLLLAPDVPSADGQVKLDPAPGANPVAAMPGYQTPPGEWRSVDEAMSDENCRDRIHQVREQRGLPRLERQTADPDEPLMIWAVDRREHGCAVMVVAGNPEDIRPLPNVSGEVERIPAD